MRDITTIKDEIAKTETILAESREYFEKNPEEYSAKLLLMSTENHLADLLRELDAANLQNQQDSK